MEPDYGKVKEIAGATLRTIISGLPGEFADREKRLYGDLTTSKDSSFKKLEQIYSLMDSLLAYVSKYIPCREGCSDCCYLKVPISSIEADYIQARAGIRQAINLENKNLFGSPCPFLKAGSCSFYAYRPFVCRRHVALYDSPRWCRLELCGKYKFPVFRRTVIESSFEYLVSADSAGFFYDIRQVFT